MPGRKIPLVTSQIYHVFNRGVNKQPIFFDTRDYRRALDIFGFYMFSDPPSSFSKFLGKTIKQRTEIFDLMKSSPRIVSLISFCLMPNHFHILLQQNENNGISNFLSKIQNSFTRYINTKHERVGPLFQGQFKAVRIEDENQLVHVSRYIHLNPYTSYIVKSLNEIVDYPWSSLKEYLLDSKGICEKNLIAGLQKDTENHKRFIFDQANYQRELKKISHLILD